MTAKKPGQTGKKALFHEHLHVVFKGLTLLPKKTSWSIVLSSLINYSKIISVMRYQFNGDFHSYNIRSRNNIHKSTANRTLDHWSSVNFCSELWNRSDIPLGDAEWLTSLKSGLSKAVL